MPGDKPNAVAALIKRRTFLALLGLGAAGLAARFVALPPFTNSKAASPGKLFPDPRALMIPGMTWFKGFKINTVEERTQVKMANWSLQVGGLTAQSVQWRYRDITALPMVSQVSNFHCVEGWGVDNVRWEGIRLSTLLDIAGPRPEARYIVFHSAEGIYSDALSLEQAAHPEVMLAYQVNGEPLAESQGFPLRLVVPPMYGYKSVKWINRLELSDQPYTGYWEGYGYEVDGWIV